MKIFGISGLPGSGKSLVSELAVEKGTPVLQKATKDLKEATANALKKIVAKLEEE